MLPSSAEECCCPLLWALRVCWLPLLPLLAGVCQLCQLCVATACFLAASVVSSLFARVDRALDAG